MEDKRVECGCHRGCTVLPHECEVPCVWPNCLSDADHDALAAELAAEEGGTVTDDVKGSLTNLAPADLEVLAGLLEALVPGEARTAWATGWHDCVASLRVVVRTLEEEEAAG